MARLADLLGERFSGLPVKQQAVARLLAEDPAFVAFASAADVAERAGVDTATVVRTCQNLGYSGWRELLAEVKRAVAARPTFDERVAALAQPDGDLTDRIFAIAGGNVEATLRDLDREAFAAAAATLSGAGTVVVAAGGVSTGVGQFLTSSLQIIGVRALLTTGASDAAPALALLGDGDAVVALSMWRYLRTTVQTLEHAKTAVGAATVAITDSSVSPAALIADHTLVVRTDTIGPRMSMTGLTALVEALVARVALADAPRSRTATSIASALYYDDNVLGSPEQGPGHIDEWPRHLSDGLDDH
jgi:DNA-binding MurR/RpiR family transcriptional regulator